tara:strand:+ start:32 stop:691 length:660 start_codon:yes stop_codon:yes gene_type:complete
MSRRKRPKYDSGRAEDQFGFLLNKNYQSSGGRSGQVKPSKEEITANRAKAQTFLGNFAQGLKRGVQGTADFFTGNRYDFDGMGANPVVTTTPTTTTEDKISGPGRELLPEGELLDRINRMRRNDFLQQSAMREFALGRETQRMKSLARDFAEMTDVYAQTAADRRLMEDRFSPTKISQQRLRAQQGEAALMNAIANQGTSAAQMGSIGTSRRFGGGARG